MSALHDAAAAEGLLYGAPRDGGNLPLVPRDEWRAEDGQGLLLAVDAEPEPRFVHAPLIGIDFPVFHDGRGLSLAVLLRSRLEFAGELRAVGDVHPELIHYLRRCGFDSFLLPAHRCIPEDDPRLAPYSDYYQASIAETQPAFRRRRRGV